MENTNSPPPQVIPPSDNQVPQADQAVSWKEATSILNETIAHSPALERVAQEQGYHCFEEAYFQHYGNYLQALKASSSDPQARAITGQLEGLWFAGKYADALQVASRYFGKVAQTSQAPQSLQPRHQSGNEGYLGAYPFRSRQEYQQASRSQDPRMREMAQKAWRTWLTTYRRDSNNPQTPYPMETNPNA